MRHEIYSREQEIPQGFRTYSILLIPDYEWFDETGLAGALPFFRRFDAFGEIIGSGHLACWFYYNYGNRHHSLLDTEIIASLSGSFRSLSQIEKNISSREYIDQGKARYDVRRARIVCTALALPYSHGPYIAFFTSYPRLPSLRMDSHHERVPEPFSDISKPELVLQLGGIDRKRALRLLDDLEQHLLRENLDVGELRWKRVWLVIEQWCATHRETLASVIRFVASAATKSS